MGLDIKACSQIRLVPGLTRDDYESQGLYDKNFIPVDISIFPDRADGLQDGIYMFEKSFGFRAGSYSGYNYWRNLLSKAILGQPAEDVWRDPQPGPFVELINFSDSQGVIGPVTSAKLLNDFTEYEGEFSAYVHRALGEEWMLEVYQKFKQAFALAADNGCVKFQ